MKKAIILTIFCVVELYSITILAYLYSVNPSGLNLAFLIVSVVITFISSILFTIALLPKKPKKKGTAASCPYFIDKEARK